MNQQLLKIQQIREQKRNQQQKVPPTDNVPVEGKIQNKFSDEQEEEQEIEIQQLARRGGRYQLMINNQNLEQQGLFQSIEEDEML